MNRISFVTGRHVGRTQARKLMDYFFGIEGGRMSYGDYKGYRILLMEKIKHSSMGGKEMKYTDIPKPIRDQMRIDELIFGNGFCLRKSNGAFERVDPAKVILKSNGEFEIVEED